MPEKTHGRSLRHRRGETISLTMGLNGVIGAGIFAMPATVAA